MSEVDPYVLPTSNPRLPYVNSKIHAIGCDFLLPCLEPFGCFVEQPEEAEFFLAMNSFVPSASQGLAEARRCHKPLAWWTIEDPNAFEIFLDQPKQADFIFTSDAACIPLYRARLGHDRVFWLPLACGPTFHHPLRLVEGASDFVISTDWYENQPRLWGVETVVEPLRNAGYTLTLFCYTSFMWPPQYHPFWRGEASCRTIAEQYRHGRVVLGVNNPRSGMDGREKTYMTSMRTFEALACESRFLQHIRMPTRNSVSSMANTWLSKGRHFVLTHHTYAHRLARLADVVLG